MWVFVCLFVCGFVLFCFFFFFVLFSFGFSVFVFVQAKHVYRTHF